MTAAVRLIQAVTLRGLLAFALTWISLPLNSQDLPCDSCHDPLTEAATLEDFAASVHGMFSCTDCHGNVVEFPHAGDARDVDCAVCHDSAVAEYDNSVHALARANGQTDAADCTSCHGDIHRVTLHTESTSTVHWTHLAENCANCHADPSKFPDAQFSLSRPVSSYLSSVHARLVSEGRRAAVCSDCHGNHDIHSASDPRSGVYHQNLPTTCGACHAEISATFAASVHGRAVTHGVREAPVCTDCHGEHRILSPDEPGSLVYSTNVSLQTCGRCHSDVRLSQKYGLPDDRVPAYADSYHGLATRIGVQTVANCASCHGVHDIQPSTDPRSHVHPDNLAQTCGQCHPGAGERFRIGTVHLLASDRAAGIVYWVRLLYLPLIFLTIGLMVLHNLLDLVRKSRLAHRNELVRAVPRHHRMEERMARGFRLAHYLVMLSFPVLVYTGFALKYPEQWWALPVNTWEESLGLRGWLHRAAGVVLLFSLVAHLIHVALDRPARRCILAMRPGLADWRELKHRIRYYLGFEKQPPEGMKLGYIEKSEYLAFLWGMAVMGATGLLLWFENVSLRWLPTWIIDASTAVHFYEAILATLAILVWHFYWVIFDPAVYPMDWSWLTGYAPPSRAFERGEVRTVEPVKPPPVPPSEASSA